MILTHLPNYGKSYKTLHRKFLRNLVPYTKQIIYNEFHTSNKINLHKYFTIWLIIHLPNLIKIELHQLVKFYRCWQLPNFIKSNSTKLDQQTGYIQPQNCTHSPSAKFYKINLNLDLNTTNRSNFKKLF